MEHRRRFMMVANALLYFGPLLAGLAGFGWGLVAVFTAIFMLWLIILQPDEVPISRADWLSPAAWVAIGARAAVQLLLVVVLFGIGRGIGGILGAMAGFPPMLPIAISFLSIALARMLGDPRAMAKAAPADHIPTADGTAPTPTKAPVSVAATPASDDSKPS